MANEAEALKNQGNALRAKGDLEGALQAYRRALEFDASYAPALYNAGVVSQEAGRPSEAEGYFRRVVALDAADRDAWFRLGLVLALDKRYSEAVQTYEQALRLDGENPLLWLELARSRKALGQAEAAMQCLSRTLELAPRLDEAHNMLGLLLQDVGDLGGAIAHYRSAAALDAGEAAYLNNLGCALGLDGSLDEAIASLRRAVGLRADDAHTHRNLGELYGVKGERDLALQALRAASRLSPGDPAVQASLLYAKQYVCEWSEFDALCQARRRGVLEHPETPTDPFSLLSIPSTRQEQLAAARAHAQRQLGVPAGPGTQPAFTFARNRKRRLRIGYLSADFHEHATAHLMAELFELHDRQRFEVCAYSYGPDDRSAMRARLQHAFDRFCDIAPMPHAAAAGRIHGDGIDILVDLKGYTTHARSGILALRPAAIQVSYLGYPGTMGADFIDYLVADSFITPPEHEGDYSEKLVLMPASYQVNDRKRPVSASPGRDALGLPQRAFVFCSFNQPYKILPGVFHAWMRLLAAVPQSVLWLLQSNPLALENLRREAAAHGIEPRRIIAAPLLRQAEHLGRLRAADLFLDTAPYNAHTSASDALWAGLPVLTCPGETFASRVAGSLVRAAGVPELVVPSLQAYEQAAQRLARNPEALMALREKLAAGRAGAPLFDTPAFARNLESAFERMWQLWSDGRPPERIDLS